MTSNVKSINRRVRETALKSRYQRVERVGDLSPDNALPAAGKFDRAAIAPPGSTYLCVEESPIPGWELIHDYYTHELFERLNALFEPARNYRGSDKTKNDHISRYTLDIDAEFVRRIRGIVDRVKQAVVDALDPNLSSWGRELFDEDILMSPPASQQTLE